MTCWFPNDAYMANAISAEYAWWCLYVYLYCFQGCFQYQLAPASIILDEGHLPIFGCWSLFQLLLLLLLGILDYLHSTKSYFCQELTIWQYGKMANSAILQYGNTWQKWQWPTGTQSGMRKLSLAFTFQRDLPTLTLVCKCFWAKYFQYSKIFTFNKDLPNLNLVCSECFSAKYSTRALSFVKVLNVSLKYSIVGVQTLHY